MIFDKQNNIPTAIKQKLRKGKIKCFWIFNFTFLFYLIIIGFSKSDSSS